MQIIVQQTAENSKLAARYRKVKLLSCTGQELVAVSFRLIQCQNKGKQGVVLLTLSRGQWLWEDAVG